MDIILLDIDNGMKYERVKEIINGNFEAVKEAIGGGSGGSNKLFVGSGIPVDVLGAVNSDNYIDSDGLVLYSMTENVWIEQCSFKQESVDKNVIQCSLSDSLNAGDLVRLGASGWELSSVSSGGIPCNGIVVDSEHVRLFGVMTYSNNFDAGSDLWVSNSDSGKMTSVMPSSTGSIIQNIGKVLNDTEIFFNPVGVYVEV